MYMKFLYQRLSALEKGAAASDFRANKSGLTQYYNHTGSAYGLVGITVGPRAGFFSGFAIMGTYLFFSIATLAALGAFTNAFLAALFPGQGIQIPWFVTACIGAIFSWLLNTRDGQTVARVLMIIEGLGIVLMLILAAVIAVKHPRWDQCQQFTFCGTLSGLQRDHLHHSVKIVGQ